MRYSLTAARSLSGLALGLLLQACAQNPVTDAQSAALVTQPGAVPTATPASAALRPAAPVPLTVALPALADPGSRRFDQAWDVVELMGQPMLAGGQRPPRVVLRPQGGLMVDGGCNYFSGRIERDAQGLFRVFKYGGTHGACEEPPRSEAVLNSALMMVDNFRWDRGLLLRSGETELLRLQPSANQDNSELEQALVRRPVPAAAAAAVPAPAACRPVKVAKSSKGRRVQAAQSCQPAKVAAARSGSKAAAKSSSVKAGRRTTKPAVKPGSKVPAKATVKSSKTGH